MARSKKKNRNYGFGIVGCGMISEFQGKAIQAMQGGHLECVYSRSEKNARRRGKQFGVPWYTDYKKFLLHSGLDIVTVCTPSGAHVDPCVKAAEAKKHVICEKPLEVTLARCDAIINACRKNRVMLGGVFPSRFSGATCRIKEEIDKGRLGRLTVGDAVIKWYRTQEYYDSGAWRGTWELDGGGALMNQSIHTIDLLQWFMGPVTHIIAYADCLIHKRIEVEDAAAAVLRFKNGGIGTITGTTAAFPGLPRKVQVSGEHGTIFLEDSFITKWEFQKSKPYDKTVRKKYGKKQGGRKAAGAADPSAIDFTPHQKQFSNFVNALNGREKLLVDGKEARKAVEMILAIYKSAHTGKTVSLPLKQPPPRKSFK